MNVRIDFRDEQMRWHFGLEADSARFTGTRTTLGPALLIGTVPSAQPAKITPLVFSGWLFWGNENHGLLIPPQPLRGGHGTLAVPVTDLQLAAIERSRKESEPFFSLSLHMTAQTEDKSVLLLGGHEGRPADLYPISGDVWRRALDACGYGRIRIVELPPAPMVDGDWAAAADALVLASDRIRSGDYAGSKVAARTALECMLEALEGRLQLKRPRQWGQRVELVAKTIAALHDKNGNDPYDLHAQVIRSLHGFASGGAHRLVATLADAEYAFEVTTALYRHLVRMPIPQVREAVDDVDRDQTEDV
jgi:hypothetical protein